MSYSELFSAYISCPEKEKNEILRDYVNKQIPTNSEPFISENYTLKNGNKLSGVLLRIAASFCTVKGNVNLHMIFHRAAQLGLTKAELSELIDNPERVEVFKENLRCFIENSHPPTGNFHQKIMNNPPAIHHIIDIYLTAFQQLPEEVFEINQE